MGRATTNYNANYVHNGIIVWWGVKYGKSKQCIY
jgi:hypothetical protein